MTKSNNSKKITIEEDGKTFSYGGVTVSFNERGGVDVYGNAPVTVHPAANEDHATAKVEPQVGDVMPDGTIYAGMSPDTGRPMYTTPADAPLTMEWRQALKYAAGLEAHGHKDWRLPLSAELNVLFNNRAAIDGFDTSRSFPTRFFAWGQRFSDGGKAYIGNDSGLSVRCVRG